MIPVNKPDIGEKASDLLSVCADTGWISSAGDFIDQFERMFADFIGVEHAVTCCNGSAALQLAIEAMEIGPGDEVIMPAHTIISCPAAVLRAGAKPVLVDMEPESWQMDVTEIPEKITENTAAIMPVHIFGHPTEMGPIRDAAVEHDLFILEDAAEAHGARYNGDMVGSIGDIATFSFYANKIITTGEGGMVVTDNNEFAKRSRQARNLFFKDGQRFIHDELGYNYRMTNMQAALGVAQMERAREFIERKKWQREMYLERLEEIDGIQFQKVQSWANHVNWVFGTVLDETIPFDASKWAEKLMRNGVETRPFFWPIHEQPVFKNKNMFTNASYPVAERIARRGLYLPSGMALTEDQINDIAEAVETTIVEQ